VIKINGTPIEEDNVVPKWSFPDRQEHYNSRYYLSKPIITESFSLGWHLSRNRMQLELHGFRIDDEELRFRKIVEKMIGSFKNQAQVLDVTKYSLHTAFPLSYCTTINAVASPQPCAPEMAFA